MGVSSMPFCSQCGAQLQDNMRFCPSCGSKAVVVETSVSANPIPLVDSIQEKHNIRNQNLNEINRMIEYFGQKSALYDEIEVLGAEIQQLQDEPDAHYDTSIANALYCFFYFAFRKAFLFIMGAWLIIMGFSTLSNPDGAAMGLFFIVIGGLVLFLAIKLRNNRQNKIEQYDQRCKQIASELKEYYQGYGPCAVGSEYSAPKILVELKSIIESGRADTIKEAVNIWERS